MAIGNGRDDDGNLLGGSGEPGAHARRTPERPSPAFDVLGDVPQSYRIFAGGGVGLPIDRAGASRPAAACR